MTVTHEHPGDANKESRPLNFDELVRERFQMQQNYGEVNSCVLSFFQTLPVDRTGVILRDPRDIMLSALNKHPALAIEDKLLDLCAHVRNGLEILDRAASEGICVWRFEQFTTQLETLRSITNWSGCEDVLVNKLQLRRKVNSSGREHFMDWHALGGRTDVIDRHVGWFVDKYYGDHG